jgi:hypothetical protein
MNNSDTSFLTEQDNILDLFFYIIISYYIFRKKNALRFIFINSASSVLEERLVSYGVEEPECAVIAIH